MSESNHPIGIESSAMVPNVIKGSTLAIDGALIDAALSMDSKSCTLPGLKRRSGSSLSISSIR